MIRKALAADVDRLNDALKKLSEALGDTHRATSADLLQHGFGADPAYFGLVAEADGADELVGALLASPMFSTSYGGAGIYVSDLWVAGKMRGKGLGPDLLKAVFTHAPATWSVKFLKLTVYRSNEGACRFYERLGFESPADEIVLSLKGERLEQVRKS